VGANEEEVALAWRRREVVGTVRLPVSATFTELATAALGERRRSVSPMWFTLESAPEHHRRKGEQQQSNRTTLPPPRAHPQ
jgi:hypothetical protein